MAMFLTFLFLIVVALLVLWILHPGCINPCPTGPTGTGFSGSANTGPTGPPGLSITGPPGLSITGPSGLSVTGPTGLPGLSITGAIGPTGEIGVTGPPGISITGPTGPSALSLGLQYAEKNSQGAVLGLTGALPTQLTLATSPVSTLPTFDNSLPDGITINLPGTFEVHFTLEGSVSVDDDLNFEILENGGTIGTVNFLNTTVSMDGSSRTVTTTGMFTLGLLDVPSDITVSVTSGVSTVLTYGPAHLTLKQLSAL